MSNEEFLKQVMVALRSKPTEADIDFLVAAHAKLGYMAAEAEANSERAYNQRKHQEAVMFNRFIQSDRAKMTAAAAERMVEIEVQEYRENETTAKERYNKINNLLRSVTEAINAIKYVGRSHI